MKDLVGQTLGHYRIEVTLGYGGMGQVFRGKHVYLDRPAAIKVMHDHLATHPTFRARFLQEAKSTAALRNPHIVEIYEFGEQYGLLYLILEMMTEGTLSTLLYQYAGDRVESVERRLVVGLDLVRQAAEGLAAAHAQGVIHRDIKPDNLLLTRLSSSDQGSEQYQLKISDFGLARLPESSGLSMGSPVGTPAYMSPEQCQNKTLDGRSDLYSLGVVLYEVVTGYLPFQINSFNDAVREQVNALPPPLQQLCPDLPPFVEQIILRCLAKRPDERYQTGKELAEVLQQAINRIGVETRAPLVPSAPLSTPLLQVPRIRILDLSGQTIRVAEVTRQGLIIGRQNDCDMVLLAETISRRHLQVQWDGNQTTVTDLKSSYGTQMGYEKLVPQVSRVWERTQTISVGPFLLRLEVPDALDIPLVKGGKEELVPFLPPPPQSNRLPQKSPVQVASSRIGVRVGPENLTITPGQPSEIKVTLVNLGGSVDWFTPFVEGVAREWVQGQGQAVRLDSGMQEDVVLWVNVSKVVENPAREYLVTIRVSSREQPGEWGSVQVFWKVLPFWDDRLEIEPGKTDGRGAGNYTVTVRNNGNVSERYELRGEDVQQRLTYHFNPNNEVIIEPGKQATIPLQVETHRFWLGKEQSHPFRVHAIPMTKRSPQTQTAELVNRALIPNWLFSIAAALLAVVLILVLVLTVFIPRVSNQGSVSSILTPTSIATPTATPMPTATPTLIPAARGFNFSSFTNSDSLRLNGTAKIVPPALELTPAAPTSAGSAYYTQAIDPSQSFHTQFQFFLHAQSDGISFIIQSAGLSALGGFGGSLGYGGIPPNVKSGGISPSLEVEFDTSQNDGDPDGNHIGVVLNGDPTTHQPPGAKSPSFQLSGSPLNAWIDYNASSHTLQVYVDPGSTRPASPVLITKMNIVAKSAFVGFTGGTGYLVAAQDILNWQFSEGSLSAALQ